LKLARVRGRRDHIAPAIPVSSSRSGNGGTDRLDFLAKMR
jgi:hypothetical protein